MATAFTDPVIVIGGGLVGLTLAQALKKAEIPHLIYERDNALDAERGGGWAITIHWALASLQACLPTEIFTMLETIQVDPEQARKDTGRFLFLNMATGLPKYEIPPSKRMRINRKMFRKILATGLDVQFSKTLSDITSLEDERVQANFTDGSDVIGSLLVACDGGNSRARKLLFADHPELAELNQLKVRNMGTTVRMSEEQVTPLRQIDPLLFQGCHPDTGVFLWYSTVSTPALNGSEATKEPYYEGQLILSWAWKSPDDDVPNTDELRLEKMRSLVSNFDGRLKTAVDGIPVGSEIKEIRLQDWPTQPWPKTDGNITLAGDSAHAMTMYRGEAFNHGVTDIERLVAQLMRVKNGKTNLVDAIGVYEEEMINRTHDAVLLSRQACLDAHDYHKLNDDSPLVSKRARVRVAARRVSGEL